MSSPSPLVYSKWAQMWWGWLSKPTLDTCWSPGIRKNRLHFWNAWLRQLCLVWFAVFPLQPWNCDRKIKRNRKDWMWIHEHQFWSAEGSLHWFQMFQVIWGDGSDRMIPENRMWCYYRLVFGMFMEYTYNTYPVDCNFLQIMNYVKVTWIIKKVIYLLGNTLQPVNNWILKISKFNHAASDKVNS